MWIYISLPLLVIYSLVIQRLLVVTTLRNEIIESYNTKPNRIAMGMWFALLLLLGIYKGISVGTDSLMYYAFYLNNSYYGMEPVVYFFYEIARKFNNYLLFQFFMFVIFLFFIFRGIKKHCPNYLIALLFFILTFTFYTSFNQIRQIVAASLIFYFINYLVSNKKNKIKFIALIFLAVLFHKSAIFLLFFLLIPLKRINLKLVISIFVATIILYFIPHFKNIIGEIIISFSEFYGNKYENNLSFFFQMNKEKGVIQLIPIIIQMIFLIVSYFYSNNSIHNKPLYYLISNIVIINLALYSLSGIEAIDRLQLYLSVFNIYFYSFYTHQLLNDPKKYRRIMMLTIIILFWGLYYALRLYSNNQGIVPYSFFGK